MKEYFEIPIEFDHKKLEDTIISESISGKGYCCFVDHTTLVTSYRDKNGKIRNILKNALINSCDGSYIAIMANIIYKQSFTAYNGPQLFNKFIYMPVKQCIVGNTVDVYEKIKVKLDTTGGNAENIFFLPLPYLPVDKFNYKEIGSEINIIKPQFIWVSLGAPKQEEFMYRLLPYIESGVLLGVGAALNFFSGTVKDFPVWIKRAHLIWLFRVFTEPKKQIPRCLNTFTTYPLIFLKERKKKRKGQNKNF